MSKIFFPTILKKLVIGADMNANIKKVFVVASAEDNDQNDISHLTIDPEYGDHDVGIYIVDENLKTADKRLALWKYVAYDKTSRTLAPIEEADVKNFISL